jgi:hypothetical protein
MRDWVADGKHGIWIETRNLKWFYLRFISSCHGLSSTDSLAFETDASGYIHRYSSVVLRGGGRCVVETLAPSAGPPQTLRRRGDAASDPVERRVSPEGTPARLARDLSRTLPFSCMQQ